MLLARTAAWGDAMVCDVQIALQVMSFREAQGRESTTHVDFGLTSDSVPRDVQMDGCNRVRAQECQDCARHRRKLADSNFFYLYSDAAAGYRAAVWTDV